MAIYSREEYYSVLYYSQHYWICDGRYPITQSSTYSKLMPVTKDTASFFSFYDVTEKIAIVIGIFSFGFLTELTGSKIISSGFDDFFYNWFIIVNVYTIHIKMEAESKRIA